MAGRLPDADLPPRLEGADVRARFDPIGIGRDDLRWQENAYRSHQLDGIARREFGAGISANIEAMARFGYLYLRGGRWNDREVLPGSFVELARRCAPDIAKLPVLEPPDTPDRFGPASAHYGLLWWNNNDGTLTGVPRDAFWTWGLYDSVIVVIPSFDIVVARAGKSWPRRQNSAHYDVLQPFLRPICAAVRSESRLEQTTPSAGWRFRPGQKSAWMSRGQQPVHFNLVNPVE